MDHIIDGNDSRELSNIEVDAVNGGFAALVVAGVAAVAAVAVLASDTASTRAADYWWRLQNS